MNVLVATLGGSWQVIPEIYGFTNPDDLPLYRNASSAHELERMRREHGIVPVDEIWIATTAGTVEPWRCLREWQAAMGKPVLQRWYLDGVEDLVQMEQIHAMADLIYRLVLHARERTASTGGRLYLCLAGGRKTMSTDLQQAAHVFGCDAALHVVDRFEEEALKKAFQHLSPKDLAQSLPPRLANAICPVVVSDQQPGSDALQAQDPIIEGLRFALPEEGSVTPRTDLYEAVRERIRQADSLLANYRLQLWAVEPASNFRGLYILPPRIIEKLQKDTIGKDPSRKEADLAWLRNLPKADLHCHLGGILSPEEMIQAAKSLEERVEAFSEHHAHFREWREKLARAVRERSLEKITQLIPEGDVKKLRGYLVEEPYTVGAFLLAFTEAPELLDEFIFGDLRDPHRYQGIGIERYERLGDLQGSGLLQCEPVLRATLGMLWERCLQENILYLELRCSPENYTKGNLSAERVVEILLEEMQQAEAAGCHARLIFIASRHGAMETVHRHIRLAQDLLERSEPFRRRFVGFDLAGSEHRRPPAEMRKAFRPLHERAIRITVHAGEGEDPKNIWEAVYELSADRIGHGLTLDKAPVELRNRFRDLRIALEMCPSSNDQIVGFRDCLSAAGPGRHYPLKAFLNAGLRVTVNTDNPGISRTNLSSEYLKAAAMTPEGLSRWDILHLIRNGFLSAFCEHAQRQRLLMEAERRIVEQCLGDTLSI